MNVYFNELYSLMKNITTNQQVSR